MSDDEGVVPVFVPSLAEVLARAEQVKGGPLTETEVLRIRDKADCVMMDIAQADRLAQSRGYRDVNPENCWADWHRLRVQVTGTEHLPKNVLCLPGNRDLKARCLPILEEEGVEYEFRGQDARMLTAFRASSPGVEPTLTAEDYKLIAAHKTVLYVPSKDFTARDAPAVSLALLRIGGRLLEAGALGMKCEGSGIAHSRKRWLELAEQSMQCPSASPDFWSAMFRAYVQYPLDDGDDFNTCGMHLLGQPDVIVSNSLLQQALGRSGSVVDGAVYLFTAFCMYMLVECQDNSFTSGHTFRPDTEWPPLRVEWEECTGYDPEEFFWNSFGTWRFTALD